MSSFQISANHIPDTTEQLADFFYELFKPENKPYEQLVYELQIEFKQGGSPDVSNIRIDRVNLDDNKETGRFRVVLDVTFTFGCEDICTQKIDQTSEWSFKIDRVNQNIGFSNSLYAESKSTADEF